MVRICGFMIAFHATPVPSACTIIPPTEWLCFLTALRRHGSHTMWPHAPMPLGLASVAFSHAGQVTSTDPGISLRNAD